MKKINEIAARSDLAGKIVAVGKGKGQKISTQRRKDAKKKKKKKKKRFDKL